MRKLPNVILHGIGDGKYVQLAVKDESEEEFLIFASREKPVFHADIVSLVLNNLRIKYEFIYDSDIKINVPLKEGDGYRVVGAGSCVRNPTSLSIIRGSYSMGYQLSFNSEHFGKVRKHFPNELEIKLE